MRSQTHSRGLSSHANNPHHASSAVPIHKCHSSVSHHEARKDPCLQSLETKIMKNKEAKEKLKEKREEIRLTCKCRVYPFFRET